MKKTSFKVLCALIALALALMCFASCGKDENSGDNGLTINVTDAQTVYNPQSSSGESEMSKIPEGAHPQVLFTMENGGTFTIELYPEYAPQTCENFLNLVNSGFYSGKTFHRVIKDFMAQGGMPDESEFGSVKNIYGEFRANGFEQNTLKHTRGVVSMARATSPNSASTQFFICYSDAGCAHLDGYYAAFGKVIDGMETVDAFLDVERTMDANGSLSAPVTPIVIASAKQIENAND